jgi:uncharacterized protein YdcH (DUF465 family)
MQPHQQRVFDEKNELDQKIEKLKTFTGGEVLPTLPEAEQDHLTRQLACMQEYSSILGERISGFGGGVTANSEPGDGSDTGAPPTKGH